MRPLKQGEPRYPVEADAIELLRAQPRYEPLPGQKQRVTAGLLAEGAGPRRVRWVGAPVIVALSLCAAAASAAAGGGWVTRGYQALADSLAGPSRVRAPAPAPRRAASPVQRVASSKASAAPSSDAVAVAPLEEPKPSAAAAPATEAVRPAPATDAAPPPAAHESRAAQRAGVAPAPRSAPEASNLVMEAMRALRQEGRPDIAARQLDEYMRRSPSGELAEEALALSVEAATQRGDARAKELAERYLARYPNGRFRRAAERARALFSK